MRVLEQFNQKNYQDPICVLGLEIPSENVCSYVYSLFWMSYRYGYHKIEDTHFTYDTGWGCTLRSAQMMMAEAIRVFLMGKTWDTTDSTQEDNDIHDSIIQHFIDSYNHHCSFSIHYFCNQSYMYQKGPGDWFGPSEACYLLETLAQHTQLKDSYRHLTVMCFDNGIIPLYAVQPMFHNGSEIDNAVVVLCPLRLGLHSLDVTYLDALRLLVRSPYFSGMVTGYPGHSLFCVGMTIDDQLLCLDPHVVQSMCCINTLRPKELSEAVQKYRESYHTDKVYCIPLSQIDPSFAISFFFDSSLCFQDFWASISDFDHFPISIVTSPLDRTLTSFDKKLMSVEEEEEARSMQHT